MEIKELSLIKYAFLIVCVFNFDCNQPKEGKTNNSFEQVVVSQSRSITGAINIGVTKQIVYG